MRRKVGLVLLDWHAWLPYEAVPALGSGSLIVGAVGLLAERSFAPYAIAAATATWERNHFSAPSFGPSCFIRPNRRGFRPLIQFDLSDLDRSLRVRCRGY
jgi:hypothetical protein